VSRKLHATCAHRSRLLHVDRDACRSTRGVCVVRGASTTEHPYIRNVENNFICITTPGSTCCLYVY